MEQPIVNPDDTAEAQGLESGDKVCYIKQWVQSIALVQLGEIIEVTCPSIVTVRWLDGKERLQFVRHLVKLEEGEVTKYMDAYRAEIEKEQERGRARNMLRDCVEDVAIIEKSADFEDRSRKRPKPKATVAPPQKRKPVDNPLKKKSANARRAGGGSLKSRMLKRRR